MQVSMIIKKITIIMVFVLAGLMFFLQNIVGAIPWLTINQIVGLAIAIISAFILYIYEEMVALRKDIVSISHCSLSKSLNQCLEGNRRIKELRIFASTTGKIEPIIAAHDVQIDTCYILVRKTENNENFNVRLKSIINDWKELQSLGRIKTLKIRTIDFKPSNYLILFDKKIAIYGLFFNNANSQTLVSVDEPFIYHNTSLSNIKVIEKMFVWFNALFNDNTTEDWDSTDRGNENE